MLTLLSHTKQTLSHAHMSAQLNLLMSDATVCRNQTAAIASNPMLTVPILVSKVSVFHTVPGIPQVGVLSQDVTSSPIRAITSQLFCPGGGRSVAVLVLVVLTPTVRSC